MGSYSLRTPDIGEGIAEVEVVAWHVKVGDTVAEDQVVAELMTDKATVEVPSPVTGTAVAIGAPVGATIAVGAELLRLEVAGAGNIKDVAPGSVAAKPPAEPAPRTPDVPESMADGARGPAQGAVRAPEGNAGAEVSAARRAALAPAEAPAAEAPRAGAPPSGSPPAGSPPSGSPRTTRAAPSKPIEPALRQPGERPLASPAVRRHALDLGIELRLVRGSGPAGRILKEDLLAHRSRAESPAAVTGGAATSAYLMREDETAIPVIGLRRRIAQKMQDAKRRIPHFSYVEEIDVSDLETTRAALNTRFGATRGKLTVLPLLARAIVIALRDFPQMNARYDDEATDGGGAGVVTRFGAVHLGIATQTDNGLMVPVIRHAEARDPWSCAAEIARLSEAARTGRGTRDELSGSTITITSLGALGGIVTTPVINAPEVAIIGVNKIIERPVIRDGAVVARKLMNLSSSFDHRVVDGMDAAAFIQAIRGLLESPALLFAD